MGATAETGRGGAVGATWIFAGDGSRRLPRGETRIPAGLDRRPAFGHLAGSVAAGLEESGAEDDDVVLFTQHDLPLCKAPPLSEICAALRDATSPVDYVLLSRDADGAPRFRDWFFGEEDAADAGPFLDLNGGFADQAHFATAGWCFRRADIPRRDGS